MEGDSSASSSSDSPHASTMMSSASSGVSEAANNDARVGSETENGDMVKKRIRNPLLKITTCFSPDQADDSSAPEVESEGFFSADEKASLELDNERLKVPADSQNASGTKLHSDKISDTEENVSIVSPLDEIVVSQSKKTSTPISRPYSWSFAKFASQEHDGQYLRTSSPSWDERSLSMFLDSVSLTENMPEHVTISAPVSATAPMSAAMNMPLCYNAWIPHEHDSSEISRHLVFTDSKYRSDSAISTRSISPTTHATASAAMNALTHNNPSSLLASISAFNMEVPTTYETLGGPSKNIPTETQGYAFNDRDFVPSPVSASIERALDEPPSPVRTSQTNTTFYYAMELDKLPTHQFPVIKMQNIPWDLTTEEVLAVFQQYPLHVNCIPHFHLPPHYHHGIHILMDRTTGKTQSECYVEFSSIKDAILAMSVHQKMTLKGRMIHLSLSSQQELVNMIFPHLKIVASKYSDIEQVAMNAQNPSITTQANIMKSHILEQLSFITSEEVNSILSVCKNFKLHATRRCSERPYENIISIVCKIPWTRNDLVNQTQRDLVFNLLSSAVDNLRRAVAKDMAPSSATLGERMIRCGLACPGFTSHQKWSLLDVAGLTQPPPDLVSFLSAPGVSSSTVADRTETPESMFLQTKTPSDANLGRTAPGQNKDMEAPPGLGHRPPSATSLIHPVLPPSSATVTSSVNTAPYYNGTSSATVPLNTASPRHETVHALMMQHKSEEKLHQLMMLYEQERTKNEKLVAENTMLLKHISSLNLRAQRLESENWIAREQLKHVREGIFRNYE